MLGSEGPVRDWLRNADRRMAEKKEEFNNAR